MQTLITFLSKHNEDVWMMIIFLGQIANYCTITKSQKTNRMLVHEQQMNVDAFQIMRERLDDLNNRGQQQEAIIRALEAVVANLIPDPATALPPAEAPPPETARADNDDWLKSQPRKLRENLFPDTDES